MTEFYGGDWKRLDPLLIGVKRYALEQERMERIVVDAFVSPFEQQQYGWITSLLGPPTRVHVQAAPGDIITAQAVVQGGLRLPQIPLHHLFLGIQDMEPLARSPSDGLLQKLMTLRTIPGYLGSWPKSGFLDLLPLGLGGGQPDASGYSQLLLGVWRRQWDAFSVLAFDADMLAAVTPHLEPVEVESEAQIRLIVGDLSQARLQTWVNSLTADRAWQASVGNAKLLHSLSQQLGVQREAAFSAAETLLDTRLVCTLGGKYELMDTSAGGLPLWQSDAWIADGHMGPPTDYRAPVLDWFRSLRAELTMYGDRVLIRAELDMQRKPGEPKVQLPFFNLFGGGQADGAKSPPTPPAPEEIPPPAKRKP